MDRFYLSDTAANKVFQLDRSGKVLLTYGRLPAQVPGSYDPADVHRARKTGDLDRRRRQRSAHRRGTGRAESRQRMERRRQAAARIPLAANQGQRRLHLRPGTSRADLHRRAAGLADAIQSRLREGLLDGGRGLARTWATTRARPKLDKPQFMRVNGQAYIACGRSNNVYRLEGDRWLLSAALLHERVDDNKWTFAFWHDANGNGQIDDDEKTPTELPGSVLAYHGQNWLDDLSMVGMNQNGHDVWRMAPSGFDAARQSDLQGMEKAVCRPDLRGKAGRQGRRDPRRKRARGEVRELDPDRRLA